MAYGEKILFAWSGGKDSAMALHELRTRGDVEICAFMTTVTEGYERISMHGVRKSLLEKQAESIGLPLEIIYITQSATNEEYESKMKDMLLRYKELGVLTVAFGDLFLEDLKKYREDSLRKVGMVGMFPIWKRDTTELAGEFIDAGFKAIITCVDTEHLAASFAGRDFDRALLAELPQKVDPCGENGEFHSFVHAGPIFRRPIAVEKGEVVLRDNRFSYCDLISSE